MNVLKLFIFALALAPGLASAEKAERKTVAEPPALPTSCVDLELVGPEGPRPFFEKRAQNPECRNKLKAALQDQQALVAKIETLKAERAAEPAKLTEKNKKIDDLGPDLKAAQAAVRAAMLECGECTTKDVVALNVLGKVGIGNSGATWYETDGSCQIPSTDSKVLENAFAVISDSLVHAKSYPLYSPGGFANVLDFQIVDGLTFKPEADEFPPSPLNLGVWVRGPKLPVVGGVAFRYFVEANYGFQDRGATKEFSLSFSTIEDGKTLRALKFPDNVKDQSTSGLPMNVKPIGLAKVRGLWCVNTDGYIRYYTAAEFPLNVSSAADLAKDILLDTLITLSNRGQWKAAP
jgi:hypothetical protein